MAIRFTDAKPKPHLVGQCCKPSHYQLWQQVKFSEKLQQSYSPLKIVPTRWLDGGFWGCSQWRITDTCPPVADWDGSGVFWVPAATHPAKATLPMNRVGRDSVEP